MNLFTVRHFLCDPARRSDQSTVLQSSCAGFLSLDRLFSLLWQSWWIFHPARLLWLLRLIRRSSPATVRYVQKHLVHLWPTFGNQQHGTIGFRTLFHFRPNKRFVEIRGCGYIVHGNNDVKVSCLLLTLVQFDCISIRAYIVDKKKAY